METKAFIDKIAPFATSEFKRSGVLSSITIAQAALESAWGKSCPNNNLFGIKGGTKGQKTKEFIDGKWIEVVANFRSYDDWSGSIKDHSDFLVNNKRYAKAGFFECAKRLDYKGCANALQNAGYATDPSYAKLLIQIIESHNLHDYDKIEETQHVDVKKDEYGMYKIVGGDTLSSIAKQYKISVTDLMKINPQIKNASKIKAGDVINVKKN